MGVGGCVHAWSSAHTQTAIAGLCISYFLTATQRAYSHPTTSNQNGAQRESKPSKAFAGDDGHDDRLFDFLTFHRRWSRLRPKRPPISSSRLRKRHGTNPVGFLRVLTVLLALPARVCLPRLMSSRDRFPWLSSEGEEREWRRDERERESLRETEPKNLVETAS